MPYNPGVQYRGDVHMYQGATDFAQGIAGGINQASGFLAGGMMKSAEKKEQDKVKQDFLKGVQSAYENDPSGMMKTLLGPDFNAYDIGYGGVQGRLQTMTSMSALGENILGQQQAAMRQQDVARMRQVMQSLTPEQLADPGKVYTAAKAAGVSDVNDIDKLVAIAREFKGSQFKPHIVNVDGTRMMMTSDNSAIPLKADELPGNPGQETPVGKTGFSVVDLGNGKRQVIDTRNKKSVNPMDLYIARQAGAIDEAQYKKLLQQQYGTAEDGAAGDDFNDIFD